MTDAPRPGRAATLFLSAVCAVWTTYFAMTVAFTIWSLRQKFVEGTHSVALYVSLPEDATRVDAPTTGTATVTNRPMGFLDEADPRLWVSGTAHAYLSDLTPETTGLIIANHVLGILLFAAITGAVLYLCTSIIRGRAFGPALSRSTIVAGLLLAGLGTTLDILTNILNNRMTIEALGPGRPPEPYTGGSVWNYPMVWLLIGLSVTAVGIAFRIADRTQREAVALRADTAGLI